MTFKPIHYLVHHFLSCVIKVLNFHVINCPLFAILKNSVLMYLNVYYRICGVFVVVGKSREAEEKRINKELANIRSKFKG